MPNGYWNENTIQKEADRYLRRVDFVNGNLGAYKAASKKGKGFLNKICGHMSEPLTKAYSREEIQFEANKYIRRSDFRENSRKQYGAACDRGKEFLDQICAHMELSATEAYNDEEISLEAKKYNKRVDFSKFSSGMYQAANNRGPIFMDQICAHMQLSATKAYTDEELEAEAKKYKNRRDFENGNAGAYTTACKNSKYKDFCSHMEPSRTEAYEFEELRDIASQYNTYSEFKKNNNGAYKAAKKMDVLSKIRAHMTQLKGTSLAEKEIFKSVSFVYPNTKKLMDRSVEIPGKPYIKGFELDILVPELNKGIEFDGTYHHSFKYMRANKNKKSWSDDDIRNYHEIKDSWFASKGIQILHIKEEDWNKDKEACIKKCLRFLSN